MESEIDAIFYGLIHQLSTGSLAKEPTEQRTRERRPFPSRQRIAPWDGHGCPAESEFVEVQCHDLTQSGFSFLLLSRPTFTSLVAEFGVAPDLIYVGAQVLHYSRVLVHPSGVVEHVRHHENGKGKEPQEREAGESGVSRILVGCRFTRRIPRPLWVDLK